jgi:hypothetical protein
LILCLNKKKQVNKYIFPKDLIVVNHTDHERIDTMAMIILHNIMNIDTININIYYIKDGLFNIKDIELLAYVNKNPYMNHDYILFIGKEIISVDILTVISHEMVHILQMEKGDLIQNNILKNCAIYKKETVFFLKTPYELRPFEIDAFDMEKNISKNLYELLYK